MILKYELVLFKEGVVSATLQQLKISILQSAEVTSLIS